MLHPTEQLQPAQPESATSDYSRDEVLDRLFDIVHARTGIDLHCYRRGTVERRIAARLQKLRCRDYHDYAPLLEQDPEEALRLLEHVTIKVSSFFRNPDLFEQLHRHVLPRLLDRTAASGEVRIWSAGCGRGEEPYSIAIMLREMADGKQDIPKVTIFGTDVDESALAAARQGIYPPQAIGGACGRSVPRSSCNPERDGGYHPERSEGSLHGEMLRCAQHDRMVNSPPEPSGYASPELVSRHFVTLHGRFGPQYQLLPSILSEVEFLRHDLLAESQGPGGRLFDLILCRNVLIYLKRGAQNRVFRLLRESLRAGGCLCLGEAEQLSAVERPHYEVVVRKPILYCKLEAPSSGGLSTCDTLISASGSGSLSVSARSCCSSSSWSRCSHLRSRGRTRWSPG